MRGSTRSEVDLKADLHPGQVEEEMAEAMAEVAEDHLDHHHHRHRRPEVREVRLRDLHTVGMID